MWGVGFGQAVLYLSSQKKRVRSPVYLGDLTRLVEFDSLEFELQQLGKSEGSAIEDFFYFFFIYVSDIRDATDVRCIFSQSGYIITCNVFQLELSVSCH